jgi:hypothetical protein
MRRLLPRESPEVVRPDSEDVPEVVRPDSEGVAVRLRDADVRVPYGLLRPLVHLLHRPADGRRSEGAPLV